MGKVNCFSMPVLLFSMLLMLSACSSVAKDRLKPFTSDGCSSFPDGTFRQNELWLSCCVEHDKAYWLGGNYQQRKEADIALKVCVERVGEKAIAKLMMAGVRVGGSPYWPTSYRWGYGWDYFRGYDEPTEKELKLAQKMLLAYDKNKLNARTQSGTTQSGTTQSGTTQSGTSKVAQ